jgi:hypothetical protein
MNSLKMFSIFQNKTAETLEIETHIGREDLEAITVDGYGFGGYGAIVKEINSI